MERPAHSLTVSVSFNFCKTVTKPMTNASGDSEASENENIMEFSRLLTIINCVDNSRRSLPTHRGLEMDSNYQCDSLTGTCTLVMFVCH